MDKRIELYKKRINRKKELLIKEIIEIMNIKKKSIKFGFNEWNGYFLIYGKYQFETFNYLKLDILKLTS